MQGNITIPPEKKVDLGDLNNLIFNNYLLKLVKFKKVMIHKMVNWSINFYILLFNVLKNIKDYLISDII